jgi:hypothetical protein
VITKDSVWKQIRLGLKDIERSQRMTESVMKRIRKLESEAEIKKTPAANKRGN